MKITPFKNRFQAAALGALLIFAAGCEKEVPVKSPEATGALPTAQFTKQLTIGANNRSSASFVVELGANDQRILDQLNATSFRLSLNNADTAQADVSVHEEHQDAVPPALKPGQKIVSIRVLGANSSEAIEHYSIDFSDEFKRLARKEGIATRIQLSPDESLPMQSAKAAGWWFRTPYCGKVTCYGDGGSIKTGVTVYRAYRVGNTWYQSAIHTFYFFDNASCTKCAHGVTYLDDIWVFQDVLRRVDIYAGC